MSFGFSLGDFLAASNLISQVVCALREAGGSSFQYQRLRLELDALGLALREVDQLVPVERLEATVEAIKATALSCQLPLREFLQSVAKYDQGLGAGHSTGIMKDVLYKVKWVASKKLEATMKLRAEIVGYLGGINLLLRLYQVKLRILAENKARQRYECLTTSLANLQVQTRAVAGNVEGVREQVQKGTLIVQADIERSKKEASYAVQRLDQRCKATMAKLLEKVGSLSEVTLKTYLKISEIYNIMVMIRSRLCGPNISHTWFQEPIRFEDPYGRILPIPVEYNYMMIEGLVRGKFRSGRGKSLVERDQWQLFDSTNTKNIFSPENWEPIPGMRITMAMIIPQRSDDILCPRLNCPSNSYTDAPGGGKSCAICGSWFDLIPEDETYRQIVELDGAENGPYPHAPDAKSEKESMGEMEATRKRDNQHSDVYAESDDLRLLKNARLQPIQWIDIPLEQTRIPTEQFFQLASLAAKTYRESVSACGEKCKLSGTIRSLTYILHRLLEGRKQLGSALNDPKIVSRLEIAMPSCHSTLRAMENVLTRYNALGDSTKASRSLWRTVRLGNGEMISVEGLRGSLGIATAEFAKIAGTVWSVQLSQDKLQRNLQAKIEKLGTIRSFYEQSLPEVDLVEVEGELEGELEGEQSKGDIPLELHQKLVELEKEHDELRRESEKELLRKSQRASWLASRSPFAPSTIVSRYPPETESQPTDSPFRVSVLNRMESSRRSRMPDRVHDLEFATEISTSLLAQVRHLQALIAEKEKREKSEKFKW